MNLLNIQDITSEARARVVGDVSEVAYPTIDEIITEGHARRSFANVPRAPEYDGTADIPTQRASAISESRDRSDHT